MSEITGVRPAPRAALAALSGEGPEFELDGVRAVRLGGRHILVLLRVRGAAAEDEVTVDCGGLESGVRSICLPWQPVSVRRNGVVRHLLAILVEGVAPRAEPPLLKVRNGELQRSLPGAAVLARLGDLRSALREDLAGLEEDARARLVDFLASATAGSPRAGALSLSRDLALVRDALREPAPVRARGLGQTQGLNIDSLHAVDGTGFWLRGWMVDRDAPVTRLSITAPEGQRVELLGSIFRFPRPDLRTVFGQPPAGLPTWEETGFVAYFELPCPSHLHTGWIAQVENELGERTEAAVPAPVADGLAARDAILRDLDLDRLGERDRELTLRHAQPALARLQRRMAGEAQARRVVDHGGPVEAPEVSIIVPLYRRIDFLEQQLAHFVHDPELRRAELIYVLDSPEQEAALAALAPQLHELYRVPFRVVYLDRNVGYSGANNAGVAFARGRLLLFLNSDVVPDRPGWLGRMVRLHGATPGVGAVGPKLLYEDDSLQHAGLYFERRPGSGLWENAHYFKGLHRSLPAAAVPRRVPAVSGACLLLDAELYRELGGFKGMYVQGDYEDSDLCLRILEAGRSNWYCPDAELYHLEAQSYPGEVRRRASAYNLWLHTQLWGATIESLMAEPAYSDLRAPLLALEAS